jgi:tRNA-dihydrouridine synthase B
MSTADKKLWRTPKSQNRLDLSGDNGIRVLQIAGHDPELMAEAAHAAVDLGADIVDINMGCPAKKVCQKLAGSALLQDEPKVSRILDAVVAASELPVTLKMRTGWDPANKNGVRIAKIAEAAGIKSLAVHGRTRACRFEGAAEYDTIRAIKAAVSIPVFANGDIDSAEKAAAVLEHTGADAVMIGRGALGRPWMFSKINGYLDEPAADGQNEILPVSNRVQRDIILAHLNELYCFYGQERGVRVGRKHLTWYCRYLEGAEKFRNTVVRIESAEDQLQLTANFLDQIQDLHRTPDKSDVRSENITSAQKTIPDTWKELRP